MNRPFPFLDAAAGTPTRAAARNGCGQTSIASPDAFTDLDLGLPQTLAALRRQDAILDDDQLRAFIEPLRDLPFNVPSRAVLQEDIAILPGGAIAVRDPLSGVLVCDPQAALTFTAGEACCLHAAAAAHPGVATLAHTAKGIVLRAGMPAVLPPQAVSLLADARLLPKPAARPGPVLIQWLAGGATLWPLVRAPALLALAAMVAGMPVDSDGAALSPDDWYRPASADPLSVGVADYISELLAPELSDAMRFALVDFCVEGEDSLAARAAEGLALLPACFRLSASERPGDPPLAWANATARLRHHARPLVFLGLEPITNTGRAIRALRKAAHGRFAVLVDERDTHVVTSDIPLDGDAAMFAAHQAGPQGRLSVLMEPPESPAELYAIAATLADEMGGKVIAASPCWGFCHRIGPHGQEAGNASWFGMGAGLDELDDLLADLPD